MVQPRIVPRLDTPSLPERYHPPMATVKLLTDEEIATNPRLLTVFDDIRATRKSTFVNNFWRALANQPTLLERTWSDLKRIMIEPGALDPLTKELIYIAVSTTNACGYCVHSHTAAARAKGLTDDQYAGFLEVVSMASQTNALATALQVPVDPEFSINHPRKNECPPLHG